MTGSVVRTTSSRALLDEWALVLSAADIGHKKGQASGRYTLLVDAPVAVEAVAALADYDNERRRRVRPLWPVADRSTNIAWLVASAILLTQMWLGPVDHEVLSYSRGTNRASAVLAGEVWRSATALTLHADAQHAFSNAASALLFLSPLCRLLGGGTAFTLALTGGTVGNIANAVIRGGGYVGLGASTAIFAAVGLLAGTRLQTGAGEPFWRSLRPLGAALGILAMLGASPQTDVAAHTLGLIAGASIGVAFTRLRPAPLSPVSDAALGAMGAALLTIAWITALANA